MYFLYNNDYFNLEFIQNSSDGLDILKIFIFCVLFSFGMIMLLPIALFFLLTAGIVWDVLLGTLISTVSTTFAACVSFLIMRYFAKTSLLIGVKEKIVKKLNFNIKENIQVKYVVLCTLNPLLPQGPLNYAFGLTGLGLKTFIIIITLTSLGINFFYVLLGSSLKVLVIEGSYKTGIIYFGVAISIITFIYFVSDSKLAKK